MKLITLNIWGGKVFEPLMNFIKRESDETDIFCFQEVFDHGNSHRENTRGCDMEIYSKLKGAMSDFNAYISLPQDGEHGIAVFVRQSITVSGTGDFFTYRFKNSMENNDGSTMGRTFQYIQFEHNRNNVVVGNMWGLWNGGSKTDTPERLEQSRKIKDFFNQTAGSKILCGDFNLLPNTESIKVLEDGMKNLIKEHKITSTRSNLYDKENKFADYILISPDVQVKKFEVLPDVVSDHLPLVLEFD